MKSFRAFLKILVETADTPGGHILIALFIVVNGIVLSVVKDDIGKFILGEGLGSIFTLLTGRMRHMPKCSCEIEPTK